MPESFVPLERYLRAESQPSPAPTPVPECAPEPSRARLHEFRRFYACVADAVETARADLLRDLAADVLARELQTAPVEIERIASKLLSRFSEQEPVHVLAHAAEIERLRHLDVPVHPAEHLRRGDITLVLRYGSIDASLGARMADVLSAHET